MFIAEEMSAGFYLSLGDSMRRKDTDIERYPSDPAMGGVCVGYHRPELLKYHGLHKNDKRNNTELASKLLTH